MHFVSAKSLLSGQNGINVYRGCTHGCIYCDSRSTCYGFTHSFEDIEVKANAPQLLENVLKSKRRRCMIGTGSMCDSYMHCEEKLNLTRQCLEIIEKHGFGAAVQTKSARVLRDIDLLDRINRNAKAVVQMTMTTYDEKLCRIIEPNVSSTRERFDALCTFRDRGIPTIVWLSPILPYINDTEENIEGILELCRKAEVKGILCFGMGLTLRAGSREYFYAALDRYFPGMKQQYRNKYGESYELASPNNAVLMKKFYEFCSENRIMSSPEACFSYLKEFPEKYEQMDLFGEK